MGAAARGESGPHRHQGGGLGLGQTRGRGHAGESGGEVRHPRLCLLYAPPRPPEAVGKGDLAEAHLGGPSLFLSFKYLVQVFKS